MYNRDQQLCSEIKAAVYSSSGKVYNWKLSPNTLGRRLIVSDIILETFSPTLKHTYSPLNRHEMISPDDEIYQKLSAEFSAIRKEINSEPVFSELIDARVRLLTLMINLWMEHIYGNSALVNTNNLAFRFHMLVDKYYKSQKNVAFYANELCITSNYLGVLCRKQYKKSPSAFIKERVLLEAKQMLHSSDKSIKEIAFELGFRNFSHFSYFSEQKQEQHQKLQTDNEQSKCKLIRSIFIRLNHFW